MPAWTPKNLTDAREAQLKQRALDRTPGGRRAYVNCGIRRIYVDVSDSAGELLASYRTDKAGVLRPWRAEWVRE